LGPQGVLDVPRNGWKQNAVIDHSILMVRDGSADIHYVSKGLTLSGGWADREIRSILILAAAAREGKGGGCFLGCFLGSEEVEADRYLPICDSNYVNSTDSFRHVSRVDVKFR
jgi:hypothetical protein